MTASASAQLLAGMAALSLTSCKGEREKEHEPASTRAPAVASHPASSAPGRGHEEPPPKPAKHEAPPGKCGGWPILVGHDAEHIPRRAYIPAARKGRPIAMELDTGSATSFVSFELKDDAAVERSHETVTVGDAERSLPGRRMSMDPDTYGAKQRGDLTIGGVFGADEVLNGTTDLDLRGGCLTRHPRGTVLPETAGWTSVPFKVVNGVIVTTVTIDGEHRGALFDTGVGYSILVADKVDPYVTHQVVHDVRGLRVDLYDRRGSVRWGNGAATEVWVERTKSFHTFDDMKLGDVRTMVGISAMGSRRIVVDSEREVLLVEPVIAPGSSRSSGAPGKEGEH